MPRNISPTTSDNNLIPPRIGGLREFREQLEEVRARSHHVSFSEGEREEIAQQEDWKAKLGWDAGPRAKHIYEFRSDSEFESGLDSYSPGDEI
jgi:hypothetical protein